MILIPPHVSEYKNRFFSRLNTFFNSYSEILFLRNRYVGLLILITTLVNPNLAIAGILSVTAAYLFAILIHMDKTFLSSGFYTYNPLLVGLGIGYLFSINMLTLFFILSAGVFTLILTIALNNLFSIYFRLPILSLPFVIVSAIADLASSRFSNLFVTGLYTHPFTGEISSMPFWLTGFFKSLGAIFFLPYVIPGIIFTCIIFFSSRILFMLMVAGYFVGTITSGLLQGSFYDAFSNLNHFNFILIAMAVGGIFLIPSIKSYFLAMIAVVMSTMLVQAVDIFGGAYGIPGFTLPFNIITMSFVYVLGLVPYPHIAIWIKSTPEDTLDFFLSNARRHQGSFRTLHLPFSGKWTVWQGFDGKWTHRSKWQHAYDFVITGADGRTYTNGGIQLTDYYAFNKPVLCPIRGRVQKIVNHLPENPVGQVDEIHNWGNLVIIHDDRGFFVEISHFAHNSIKVKPGDWLEPGMILGLCGNSGFSPQPHIHIQVQITGEVGAHTLPFSFINYCDAGRFFANDLPEEQHHVEPLFKDKELEAKTAFILDDKHYFEVLKSGRKIDDFALAVKTSDDGTFYFDSGKGKLFFGRQDGRYAAFRLEGNDIWLKHIFMALPSLPAAYKKNLLWREYLPMGVFLSGIKKQILQFLSSFYNNLSKVETELTYTSDNVIEGITVSEVLKIAKRSKVVLDDARGFESIAVESIEIKRKKIEKNDVDGEKCLSPNC